MHYRLWVVTMGALATCFSTLSSGCAPKSTKLGPTPTENQLGTLPPTGPSGPTGPTGPTGANGLPALASTQEVVSHISGTAYYVSPDGNDAAATNSSATPWKTIQHAANQVQAGDAVIVRAGSYAGFQIGWDIPVNGTAERPIVFHGEPGATIISRNSKTADGINLEGSSYIAIEGFTITNAGASISRAGIRTVASTDSNGIVHNSESVTLRFNTIKGMGTWGIFTSHGDHLTIDSNSTSDSVGQHGIYVSNACVYPVITHNLSFGNHGCGIHMNGDISQGGNGLISNALVDSNIIHDNGTGGGSAINMDGVQNSIVQNNVLYNNHASGISMFQIDAAGPAKNNVIVSNTILEASDARWDLNIQNGSTGVIVFDNILLNSNPAHGSVSISADSLTGFMSDHNIGNNRYTTDDANTVLSLAQWRTATGQDLNSSISTEAALFVDSGLANFHLKPGSPALAGGLATFSGKSVPISDVEKKARPLSGAGPDIGAFQTSP